MWKPTPPSTYTSFVKDTKPVKLSKELAAKVVKQGQVNWSIIVGAARNIALSLGQKPAFTFMNFLV